MVRFAVAAIAVCLLAGCEPSLEDQQANLDRFVAKNRHGTHADMWLVRDGVYGSERVALIYAFAPDSAFCLEVAEMYNEKYPTGATYTCQAAN